MWFGDTAAEATARESLLAKVGPEAVGQPEDPAVSPVPVRPGVKGTSGWNELAAAGRSS